MSSKLGYKPAAARKEDIGRYSTSGATKPRPKGKKIGMDKKMRSMAKKMLRSYNG